MCRLWHHFFRSWPVPLHAGEHGLPCGQCESPRVSMYVMSAYRSSSALRGQHIGGRGSAKNEAGSKILKSSGQK